ncbi:MAG: hypothetical protein ACYSWU_01815 [Planctomycetota bacterium]|jgi:hypothetical protein
MDKVKNANYVLGLLGAAGGGAIGYFVFFLLARQGLYAIVLPGALLGLGCGALSRGKSNLLGVVCGLLGLLLGVFIEWRFAPFVADNSLWFFVTHLDDLATIKLVMIALGGLFAFWFGRGRQPGVWKRNEGRRLSRRN